MDEDLLRSLVPEVISVLGRRGADFAAAEDAVQEGLIEALRTWPDQPPRDPKGWLVTTAWRKFLDLVRASDARRRREERTAQEPPAPLGAAADDTLEDRKSTRLNSSHV